MTTSSRSEPIGPIHIAIAIVDTEDAGWRFANVGEDEIRSRMKEDAARIGGLYEFTTGVEPVGVSEDQIQEAIRDSADWPNGDPARRWWRRPLRKLR